MGLVSNGRRCAILLSGQDWEQDFCIRRANMCVLFFFRKALPYANIRWNTTLSIPNLTINIEQGNFVFATELARRYGSEGIVSICVEPGNLKTDLQRHQSAFQHWVTVRIVESVSSNLHSLIHPCSKTFSHFQLSMGH